MMSERVLPCRQRVGNVLQDGMAYLQIQSLAEGGEVLILHVERTLVAVVAVVRPVVAVAVVAVAVVATLGLGCHEFVKGNGLLLVLLLALVLFAILGNFDIENGSEVVGLVLQNTACLELGIVIIGSTQFEFITIDGLRLQGLKVLVVRQGLGLSRGGIVSDLLGGFVGIGRLGLTVILARTTVTARLAIIRVSIEVTISAPVELAVTIFLGFSAASSTAASVVLALVATRCARSAPAGTSTVVVVPTTVDIVALLVATVILFARGRLLRLFLLLGLCLLLPGWLISVVSEEIE